MKLLAMLCALLLISGRSRAEITDPSCSGVLHGIAENTEHQPVPSIRLVLRPIGIDLDYILPTTTSNEAGAYSFEHVCAGRFTVLVDDERAGYPPEIWSYLLGYKHEAKVTSSHVRIELPVVVPPKAALLKIVARNRRTNVSIPTLQIMLRTSKVKMYDWITMKNESSQPLLLPANTDLLCRVLARGYREWEEGRKKGKQIRLAPSGHITFDVQLEPER
jgi:hypothetical protein